MADSDIISVQEEKGLKDLESVEDEGETIYQNPAWESSKEEVNKASIFGLSILAGEAYGTDLEDHIDFVAISGPYQTCNETWKLEGSEDRPASNWLKEQFYDRPEYGHDSRVITFDYETTGIQELTEQALKLLNGLVNLRQRNPRRPIVFVTADFGGIVLKEALRIVSDKPRKYMDIGNSTRLLIFLGYPHRCASIEDMEALVPNLIGIERLKTQSGVLDTIRNSREIARSAFAINGYFSGTLPLLAYKILNIYPAASPASTSIWKYTCTLDIAFERSADTPSPRGNFADIKLFDVVEYIRQAASEYQSVQ